MTILQPAVRVSEGVEKWGSAREGEREREREKLRREGLKWKGERIEAEGVGNQAR